jgi:phosphoesterase RecJ-like protein
VLFRRGKSKVFSIFVAFNPNLFLLSSLDFSTVSPLFTQPKKIFITSHSNPDGDAVGSALALYHFFSADGHDVHVMVPNAFPDFLKWLPGQEKVLFYEDSKDLCDRLFREAELLFSLDYNAPSRIGDATESFIRSQATKILIDHHIEPERNAYDHCFSTTQTSSTSELVYQFMEVLGREKINRAIAENIFAGIMTDTGSFSYNCNYVSTFRIAADLIALGVDAGRINREVYSSNNESRIRLLGYALDRKLTVVGDFHTAYIALTKEELDAFNFQTGDTEGLVNYALSIKGIRFAALFTEKDDKIRISFRSNGSFSVNDFARKHFEGGGHKNAAGGDSFLTMDQTIDAFIRLLDDYKKDLT